VIVGSQKNVGLTRREQHIFLMVFGSGRIALAWLVAGFRRRGVDAGVFRRRSISFCVWSRIRPSRQAWPRSVYEDRGTVTHAADPSVGLTESNSQRLEKTRQKLIDRTGRGRQRLTHGLSEPGGQANTKAGHVDRELQLAEPIRQERRNKVGRRGGLFHERLNIGIGESRDRQNAARFLL
jgi:hypothetical protein